MWTMETKMNNSLHVEEKLVWMERTSKKKFQKKTAVIYRLSIADEYTNDTSL